MVIKIMAKRKENDETKKSPGHIIIIYINMYSDDEVKININGIYDVHMYMIVIIIIYIIIIIRLCLL